MGAEEFFYDVPAEIKVGQRQLLETYAYAGSILLPCRCTETINVWRKSRPTPVNDSKPTRSRSPRKARVVHGDDLLYEFFQNVLSDDDPALIAVPQLLLQTMGIWWPLDVYRTIPVLLPFVVRDTNCRSKPSIGRPDAWSSPNSRGYLRDDNTLIKSLPRALEVDGPRSRKITGAKMGTEFVAAHVWRTVVGTSTLASRIPGLNSFVPNLVWLPSQIAKLTDREGSIVQQTAQAMAWAIYRDAPVDPHLSEIVEGCWERLPEPERPIAPLDVMQLNWFRATPRFMATREQRIRSVVGALRCVQNGQSFPGKIVASRYTAGLAALPSDVAEHLASELSGFLPRVE